METERGRWFLAEYTRRNRSADTVMLLDAIKKLGSALQAKPKEVPQDELRFDLMEMAATIAQTRLDIAALASTKGSETQITTVAGELDQVVDATEKAAYKILAAAEAIQDVAWDLREVDTECENSEILEARVTDIFSACEFQDLTGQRITKVVQVLHYIEERLNSMISAWGDESLIEQQAPPEELDLTKSYLRPEIAISQDTVDELMFINEAQQPIVDINDVDFDDIDFDDIDVDAVDAAPQPEPVAAAPEDKQILVARLSVSPDFAREPTTSPSDEPVCSETGEEDDHDLISFDALSQDDKTVLFC